MPHERTTPEFGVPEAVAAAAGYIATKKIVLIEQGNTVIGELDKSEMYLSTVGGVGAAVVLGGSVLAYRRLRNHRRSQNT